MDLMNLNKLIEQLKKVNEEVIETKRKSNFDLRVITDLKSKYTEKSKELDEARDEIEELKHLSKLLGDKLKSLERIKLTNKRLQGKVKRLKSKLESAQNDNRFYLNELEEVKSLSLSKNDPLQKVYELQKILSEKEKEYNDDLERIRNETKTSLITLESKIVTKLKTENLDDTIKNKLNDKDEIIKRLNGANLRLREKLLLKCSQYKELEENFVRLKVEMQKLKQKNNYKSDILTLTESKDDLKGSNYRVFGENDEFGGGGDDSSTSSGTESTKMIGLRQIGYGETFKLDFKQNEIVVEVQNCESD